MLVMIPFTTVTVLGIVSPDRKVPDTPTFCVAIVPSPRLVLAPAASVAPVPPFATAMVVAFQVPAVSVPTPVMPVYDPDIRAVLIVPDVICVALIAIGVLTELVSWPCALTA